MTLAPLWRTRFFAAGASLVAIWLSVEIAHGNFLWPSACAAALGVFVIGRYQPRPLTTLLLTVAAAGYVLGNRGFAQVSLIGRFPLLPAEIALVVGGSFLLVQCAWRHELPFRRDALNYALLAWMIAGALRIVFDIREYGFMALRDFALVYYAAFFFLGQEMSRDPASRRFFVNTLMAICALLLPVYLLSERFPDFFLTSLSFRGNPLIYYKGDLAATFLAAGSVLFYLRFEARGRSWLVVTSLVLAGAVMAMNNRASMLALFVATAWLALRGRWRFAALQAVCGLTALVLILMGAAILRISWEKTPVFDVYERVVSIADPFGHRTYRGSQTSNKGDNNLYRAVWWRAVIDETLDGNPYVGLGFGHDLAARFLREYYPESGDEFTVRSPHNVLISIFARMGAIGLLLFLVCIALIAGRTWRAIRVSADDAGPWCVVWAMLTSACLGVVLEGPMGAVVFWTVLGLANGTWPGRSTDPNEPPLNATIAPADHPAPLPEPAGR